MKRTENLLQEFTENIIMPTIKPMKIKKRTIIILKKIKRKIMDIILINPLHLHMELSSIRINNNYFLFNQ